MTDENISFHKVSIDREGELTSEELAKVIALNRDKAPERVLFCNWPGSGGDNKLSDAAAELLSKYKGGLDLSDIGELSDSAAELLSKHKGGLDLSGIGELSDSAAESLSKHQGDIELDNLGALSDAGAESLMNHPGHLEIGDGFIVTGAIQRDAVCELLDTFLPRGQEYRNWG